MIKHASMVLKCLLLTEEGQAQRGRSGQRSWEGNSWEEMQPPGLASPNSGANSFTVAFTQFLYSGSCRLTVLEAVFMAVSVQLPVFPGMISCSSHNIHERWGSQISSSHLSMSSASEAQGVAQNLRVPGVSMCPCCLWWKIMEGPSSTSWERFPVDYL